jgi:hypothetical protein
LYPQSGERKGRLKQYKLSGKYSIFVILFGYSLASNAALFDRGGGLIYDDVLNITWLQDANYAMTSGFDADGRMTWAQANAWAEGLNYYDSVRKVTYGNWRLPTTSPVNGISFDINITADASTDRVTAPTTTDGSDGGWRDSNGTPVAEMGHMYFVNMANLGACIPTLPFCSEQPGHGLFNTGPFTNVQPDVYWTDTAYNDTTAWRFNFNYGSKNLNLKGDNLYAWAVRPGDVATVPAIANGDLAPWNNPDGLINAADLLIITQLMLGLRTPDTLQFEYGDMNTDGNIDLVDLLLIKQVLF